MNRESERKRLVELIDKAHMDYVSFSTEMALAGNYDGIGTFGEFASKRLLDNGIVVPPVKVGQILYVIEAGLIFEAKVKEYKYCSNSANGIHWHIIFEELFAMSEAHIGKTVFTSREEAAEKMLKGSKNNG